MSTVADFNYGSQLTRGHFCIFLSQIKFYWEWAKVLKRGKESEAAGFGLDLYERKMRLNPISFTRYPSSLQRLTSLTDFEPRDIREQFLV